jgi:hypothetical protein
VLLLLLLAAPSLAWTAPRPNVPSSALPGRERQQLVDPFPKPRQIDPGPTTPKKTKPAKKPKRSAPRQTTGSP